jgi:hypothetical protein
MGAAMEAEGGGRPLLGAVFRGALPVAPRRIRRRRGRPAAANASSQDVGRPVVRAPRFDHVASLQSRRHNFRPSFGMLALACVVVCGVLLAVAWFFLLKP